MNSKSSTEPYFDPFLYVVLHTTFFPIFFFYFKKYQKSYRLDAKLNLKVYESNGRVVQLTNDKSSPIIQNRSCQSRPKMIQKFD